MKIITSLFFLFLSLYSNAQITDYDRRCAQRYINGTEALIEIAERLNHGRLNSAGYVTAVSSVGSSILVERVYCMNEIPRVQRCVERTKKYYQKIRRQMRVGAVMKGQIDRVEIKSSGLLRDLRAVTSCLRFL